MFNKTVQYTPSTASWQDDPEIHDSCKVTGSFASKEKNVSSKEMVGYPQNVTQPEDFSQ